MAGFGNEKNIEKIKVMEQKTILLVEDDFLNRRLSKKTLRENGYLVLEAKNAKEAFEVLKKEMVDLAIFDINLGKNQQDGISLGQYIQEKLHLPFIYLTAYENPEIVGRAVATLPYSYLTKPFKSVDLITAVALAIRQSAGKHVPKILVKEEDYNVALPIDEINYIESDGNYLLFYTDEKVYKYRSTIKQIIGTLPKNVFVQVHRAYVVNKAKIEKSTCKSVVVNGTEIPVSKKFYP